MSSTEPWTPAQRHVVLASYLGWMLDAFDFFLVVFVFRRIAGDFGTDVKSVTYALFLTLAMRPVGAFLFGRVADRYGRRPALMASVLSYSVMELASAFAPSLTVFVVLRALFGIAMGGEWGVGASLAFESIPVRSRGIVSGLLQAGYPSGYLVAAIVYGTFIDQIGWRGMFMVGAAPALLLLYIRSKVPESEVWRAGKTANAANSIWSGLKGHWPLAAYAILLMTAFNFFSHGTQDLFPHFLEVQRGFSSGTVRNIAVVYNLGAICGGLTVGALSSRIGRRRAIALAAGCALIVLPFWGLATTALNIAIAAFAMQFMVQGAWGVVPVHLNELSPPTLRATFPGFVYQLGNLIASYNAPLQTMIAESRGTASQPDFAFALMLVCSIVAATLLVLALVGPERRDVRFDAQ
jgi:SHS family lactate transporter-like MFS transporter